MGLTGGIGSGKSTVSDRFRQLGIPVIDADEVGRDLVAPGSPLLGAILERFGAHLVDSAGQLRRDLLRKRIFDDAEARHALESILHPAIRAEMLRRVAALDAPYAVLAIPLLLEAGQKDLVDRVLVVDVDESEQLRRVCQRDGGSTEEARRILNSQYPRQQRLQEADDVIRNDGNLPSLYRQVERIHRHYLKLADKA